EAITAVVEECIIKDTTWRVLQKKYGVAKATLWGHFHGKKNGEDAHEGQAHLKKDEELVLVEYCKVQGLLAQPLSSLGLHQHVYELSGRRAGEEWVRRF
ncbi:hypothetical protein M422DRAFT_96934, partial [Sphaerobolus stellatus SS14]